MTSTNPTLPATATQLTVNLNMELTSAQQNAFSAKLFLGGGGQGDDRLQYYSLSKGVVVDNNNIVGSVGSYEFTDADTIVVTLNSLTSITSFEIIH